MNQDQDQVQQQVPQQNQQQDQQHLKLLSTFYYVLAGFQGFITLICILALLVILGIGLLGAAASGSKHGASGAAGVFAFISMFACFIVPALIFAAAITYVYYLAGKNFARQKSYVFCFIIACFTCMSFPLGTALGVFSLVVLLRPSVKAMFEANDA